MRTSDFDYPLLEELIAYHPLPGRDEARLMVLPRRGEGDGGGGIRHSTFRDLPSYLREGDLLVLNDTKVIPARLKGIKEGGVASSGVEILVTERLTPGVWRVLMRKPKHGMRLSFEEGRGVTGTVLRGKRDEAGHGDEWLIEFDGDAEDFMERRGMMPLPPYIKRKPVERDREDYQTVYARRRGAVAAPTAGLHFTPRLLDRIRGMGVEVAFVTLHVGLGTFKPVSSSRVEEHRMHAEIIEVSQETADGVNAARGEGRRIVAVGTTVARALESSLTPGGVIEPRRGLTDLFIYPGYVFRAVDALITNFHLPRSTLLMLVCAFAGRERILGAYGEAMEKRYRFLSYGDAMLIV